MYLIQIDWLAKKYMMFQGVWNIKLNVNENESIYKDF